MEQRTNGVFLAPFWDLAESCLRGALPPVDLLLGRTGSQSKLERRRRRTEAGRTERFAWCGPLLMMLEIEIEKMSVEVERGGEAEGGLMREGIQNGPGYLYVSA